MEEIGSRSIEHFKVLAALPLESPQARFGGSLLILQHGRQRSDACIFKKTAPPSKCGPFFSLLGSDCLSLADKIFCSFRTLILGAEQHAVIQHDFRAVMLHAVLFPRAGLEVAFDEDRLSFLHVLAAELAELSPRREVMELSLSLPFTFRVFPDAVGGEAEVADDLACRQGLDLRRVRDVPEEGDCIHRFHREMGEEIKDPSYGWDEFSICLI